MRENHHTYEPHTEGASDHFCDRCFGSHHWQADCPADDEEDDEMIDFERITETQQLRVEIGGAETIHTVTAWKVPRDATEAQVKEAMNYWIEPTFCQHEHDCCANYYAGPPQLLAGRTYYGSDTEIVFVLQTHTLNI